MLRRRLLVQNTVVVLSLMSTVGVAILSSSEHVAEWSRYHDKIATRRELLEGIFENAGYAGAIHHFKNLVLRTDLSYYEPAKTSLNRAIELSNTYLRTSDISPVEMQAIATIRDTLQKYLVNLDVAAGMVRRGATSREVDRAVRIDDGPASLQMKKLDEEYRHLDVLALANLKSSNQRTWSYFLLVCAFVFSVTLWRILRLSRRIRGSLDALESHAFRISSGNFDEPIFISAGDDFRKLESAMEVMRVSLKAASENLRVTLANLERFAFAASHDLQEPLRKISIHADFLIEDFGEKLPEGAKDDIVAIQSTSQRMRKLIEGLLAYYRAGFEPVSRINLNEHIEKILQDLSEAIEAVSATFEIDALPTVEIGETECRQLLQNFISNALKFHKKELAPKIRIHSQRISAGFTRVFIEDNGIGFDMQYAERIKLPFERLQSGAFPGLGLGLALCDKIIRNYGGTLHVQSTPGLGSVFSFDLPTPHS